VNNTNGSNIISIASFQHQKPRTGILEQKNLTELQKAGKKQPFKIP